MFDENSIVDRIISGDDSAFERLADLYAPKVYQYALRYLGQENEAEQAVEETFLQIGSKLGGNVDSELSVWIFRIAANACADIQRRKRGTMSTMAVFHLREIRKDDQDEKRDLDEAIQSQLLRLTRQQREVILLRDLCGLNDAATGQVLGMDADGVRLRLSRARKNLRDLLLRQNILSQPKERNGDNRDCQNYRELCSQYVDEYITQEDKAALLDHIQECPQCAAYLNDLTLIGRSLSHMEEGEIPRELRERVIENTKKQSREIKSVRRRGVWIPLLILIASAAIFVALTCSGVLGGLYISATVHDTASRVEKENGSGGSSVVMKEEIMVPDVVAANSYAFVIAAAGEATPPELSTSASLLAADNTNGVEYYMVDNDFSLVQKLTEGMQSLGYELETINNNQLIISSTAPQGLFIVIHQVD
ncbi:MAG: sigma-70 family RNA polymerase sigma factor [Eubacteriales bacterium]|nr:sigma-70 family RNA polymerase sigma factor [Eubacteriales bacterium]